MEQELKENICREIVNITLKQLERVKQNLFHQHDECVHVRGQPFLQLGDL
jgi:hypothetical protein